MAIYPEAKLRLINKKYLSGKKMAAYNRINLHVDAGGALTLFNWFNAPKRASSHFYVKYNGRVEQYVDTALRAEADLEGNDATISIETQGKAAGEWTEAQFAALVRLIVWCMVTHGIKVKLATSSKIGEESKGLSWHRLGINGNFPALPSILAGRSQRGGGMHYSTSSGKVCPGDDRVRQIPKLFAAVKAALSGTSTPVKVPAVKPVPKPVKAPSKPSKTPVKPAVDRVKVDGYWGEELTRRLQTYFGTPVDGEVSGQYQPNKQPALTSGWKWADTVTVPGSKLIWEMQEVLKKDGQYTGSVDGIAGPEFYKALQRRFNTPVDGELWKASPVVKAMQRKLNSGKF